MRHIKIAFWALLVLLSALWLAAEPSVFQPDNFMALRCAMVQYSGTVPDWREASIWFCGPAGFGKALQKDFAAQGLPVMERFHQELFALR